MHQKCSNYALTNLLFGLCRFVRIINPLVICLNPHLEAPAHPFTPKVLRTTKHTPTHYPYVVYTFGLVIESITEFGVCQMPSFLSQTLVYTLGIDKRSNAFFLVPNPILHLYYLGDLMPSFLSQTLVHTLGIDRRSNAFFLVSNPSLHPWYLGNTMPYFLSQTLIHTLGIDRRSNVFFLVPNPSLHPRY